MTNQNTPARPVFSTFADVPIVPPDDRWTQPLMAEFLRVLAATQNVSAAARAVGLSRQSAYKLRARLKGTPFDIAWETAFQHGFDNLAHVALERAMEGYEVPHYYKGELVGTSRRYDERLLMFLLKQRNGAGRSTMGRYGAAREHYSEKWDALLDRVENGPLDFVEEPQEEEAKPQEAEWSDSYRARKEKEREAERDKELTEQLRINNMSDTMVEREIGVQRDAADAARGRNRRW